MKGTKICGKCKEKKEVTEFGERLDSRSGRVYLQSYCRECKRKYDEEGRGRHLWNRYGITGAHVELMLKSQGNVCKICRQPETAKRDGQIQQLSTDHCHRTHKIRGLLCSKCNRMLANAKDNPETLRNGAQYLEKNRLMIEETFIILKPDAVVRGLVSEIVERFQQIGKIEWVTGRVKNREWCCYHYAHIVDLPSIYKVLEVFMSEKFLIGFNLHGDDVIKKARATAGATQVEDAKPGTVRGDFGLKNYPTCYNLVHCADSLEAVQCEIQLFLDQNTDYNFGIKIN